MRGYPWWVLLLVDLFVFGVVSYVAYRFQAKPEFAFTWGLCAFVITICFSVLAEQRQLSGRIDALTKSLPGDIFEHHVFKTVLVADRFLAIYGMQDPLFAKIAKNQIDDLDTLLGRLQRGELELTGDRVYAVYQDLINSLQMGEIYKATTFVDDGSWCSEGGRHFLRCNIAAVKRGAKIIRIFFYFKEQCPSVQECEVARMHLKAMEELNEEQRSRFELRTLEMTERNFRDMGVLKGRYLMRITSDRHQTAPDASVITDVTTVRSAEDSWERAYNMSESLSLPIRAEEPKQLPRGQALLQ